MASNKVFREADWYKSYAASGNPKPRAIKPPKAPAPERKPRAKPEAKALPDALKAALQAAVTALGSQVAAGKELGISSAAVSQLLQDKYPGSIQTMVERIKGRYLGLMVRCPVYGTLARNHCLDYQALPVAFTNPLRSALGRACKTCPNRKKAA